MGLVVLILLIVMPIAEIAMFIQVGDAIGLWPTLGAIILTAVIGAALLRHQGSAVLVSAYKSMDAGRVPVKEIFDGACLVLGGVFLLTPGFITDTIGFLLLIPAVRMMIAAWVMRNATVVPPSHPHGRAYRQEQGQPWPDDSGAVIDGEYETVQEKPKDIEGPRGNGQNGGSNG
ncbi:MAG: FxsA family protein [Rhodospirillales bacterium]|nr:FxsA family protein [Rhodospirillales bacterium]